MNIKRTRYLIPLFIVLLLLVRLVVDIGREHRPGERLRVVRVIDGDTIELLGGDQLRLLGIDCPERGDPFYDSATALTRALVLDKTVEVVYSSRRRDGYGRLLGYLYLDTVLINEVILRRGFGNVYLFKDNLDDGAVISSLQRAQNEALAGKIGIWSIPRAREPYYVALSGSLRFHRPGCRAVRNRRLTELIRFETREEALVKGYSPCRNCRP